MFVNPKEFICWSCDVLLQKTSTTTTTTTTNTADSLSKVTTSSSSTEMEKMDHNDTSENIQPSDCEVLPIDGNAFCIHPHPLLHVTTCSPCTDRAYAVEDDLNQPAPQIITREATLDTDEVTKDDEGDANDNEMDSYCSWCVGRSIVERDDETDLLLCDTCPRAFCKRCTALAHGGGVDGGKIVEGLLSDDGMWSCIFCEAPHALKCMQEFLHDCMISEERSSGITSSKTEVGKSKKLDASSSFNIDSTLEEDDDEVTELIKELNAAEDAVSEAEQMLEEKSILRKKKEIHKEIKLQTSEKQAHLSADAVNELVETELATWIEQWKDHHTRNTDIIGTSQDLLDDKGIDPRAYYEGRDRLCQQSEDPSDESDPVWKKYADAELDKRDEEIGIRKGFYKGANGWVGDTVNYRDLEDLDRHELNEVEEINTTENTVAVLKEIEKKDSRFEGITAQLLDNALPKDDEVLVGLKIDITERQSPDVHDKELEKEKSEKDYSRSIRKGKSCVSGRIVMREVGRIANKKRQKPKAIAPANSLSNSNSSSKEEKEPKAKKKKRRVVPQLIVDLTCEEEEEDIHEENEKDICEEENQIEYKSSELVMTTLRSQKFSKDKKQTISVAKPLAKILKVHQKKGVQFMWDNVCGDIPTLVEQTQKKSASEVQGWYELIYALFSLFPIILVLIQHLTWMDKSIYISSKPTAFLHIIWGLGKVFKLSRLCTCCSLIHFWFTMRSNQVVSVLSIVSSLSFICIDSKR